MGRITADISEIPCQIAHFQREDAAFYGMFLLSGSARISRIAEDGGESALSTLKAGEVCALFVLSGLSGRDYPGAITAESEVEVLFVAKRVFSAGCRRTRKFEAPCSEV